MNKVWFLSKAFWYPFFISMVGFMLFFAWELRMLPDVIPMPSRPAASGNEKLFALLILILLSLNIGLLQFRKKLGRCPIGASRATKLAGTISAAALICPACILVPFSLLGITVSLVFLTPFLPLLRVIAVILLMVSTKMLLPKR